MKSVPATEFKARCLALIDQVHDSGQPITITKRGKVVAVLQPAGHDDAKPWLRLRDTILKYDDPFAPAVDPGEWSAMK
jgi:prevent-host-death family protein